MRNLLVSLAALFAIAACGGPTGHDIAVAKTTRYKGDKLAMFAAAKEATEAKYKLEASDETTLTLQTIGKWFTPEGLVATIGDTDMRQVPDRSIRIALTVKLVADGDKWLVQVVPHMLRYFAGRPNPDKLEPNDPSIPGWASGKVDELAYDIYAALKPYEVKAPGGVAPMSEPASPSSHGY